MHVFKPGPTIVDQVMREHLVEDMPCHSLPAPYNMAHQAQSPEPMDLNFNFTEDWIPDDFLLCDITEVEGQRHLLFANPEHLATLARAERLHLFTHL